MADSAKLVALMGCTGSGKTTFINCAAGSDLVVGHKLESCTSEIQTAPTQLGSEQITLIDTPGFDDTEIPQTEILQMIATFLQETFSGGKRLTGIIFLHRISDIRMTGINMQTYRLFRKLCGDSAMSNVAIVTTMWETIDPGLGEARLQQLQEVYFKDAVDRGARILRHDNTSHSATAILSTLLRLPAKTLRVQKQLVTEHKTIPQTDAGHELDHQLEELCRQQASKVNDLVRKLADATHSPKTISEENGGLMSNSGDIHAVRRAELEKEVRDLQGDLEGLRRKLEKTETERDKLRMALGDRINVQLQKLLMQMGLIVYPLQEQIPDVPDGAGGEYERHPSPGSIHCAEAANLPPSSITAPAISAPESSNDPSIPPSPHILPSAHTHTPAPSSPPASVPAPLPSTPPSRLDSPVPPSTPPTPPRSGTPPNPSASRRRSTTPPPFPPETQCPPIPCVPITPRPAPSRRSSAPSLPDTPHQPVLVPPKGPAVPRASTPPVAPKSSCCCVIC